MLLCKMSILGWNAHLQQSLQHWELINKILQFIAPESIDTVILFKGFGFYKTYSKYFIG